MERQDNYVFVKIFFYVRYTLKYDIKFTSITICLIFSFLDMNIFNYIFD